MFFVVNKYSKLTTNCGKFSMPYKVIIRIFGNTYIHIQGNICYSEFIKCIKYERIKKS